MNGWMDGWIEKEGLFYWLNIQISLFFFSASEKNTTNFLFIFFNFIPKLAEDRMFAGSFLDTCDMRCAITTTLLFVTTMIRRTKYYPYCLINFPFFFIHRRSVVSKKLIFYIKIELFCTGWKRVSKLKYKSKVHHRHRLSFNWIREKYRKGTLSHSIC